MGSKSDWETMSQADQILTDFGVPHEARIVSAHRTPQWMAEYASSAAARGLEVIIAGAGGAAHLPGMVASHTVLPVIGVPVQSAALQGLDSLLSIVQMPRGVPVATVAIGAAGAVNAALLAVAILANSRPDLRAKLQAYRDEIAGWAARPVGNLIDRNANALTVDVEDYFQVEAFFRVIGRSDWDSVECRIERKSELSLDCESCSSRYLNTAFP